DKDSAERADADPKAKDHSANGKADDAADSARHGDKSEADKPASDKSHKEDDAAHHDGDEHPKDTDDKHTTKTDDADSKSTKDEADTHKSDKDSDTKSTKDSGERADADPKAKDHSANGKADDTHQSDKGSGEHTDTDPKAKDHSANGKADDAADSTRHGDKTEADKPTSDKSHKEDDAAHHDGDEHPKDTDDKHTTKTDDADTHKSDKDGDGKSNKDDADAKSDKDDDTHKSDKDGDSEGSGSHDGNESSDDEPAFADGITAGGHPGPYKEANDGFIADFAEKNGHTLDTDHGPIGADLVDHREPISTDPDTGEQISADLYKERATGPDGETDWPNVKKHPELADDMIDGVYLHGDPEKGIPPFQDMTVDEFIKEHPGNLDRIGGDHGKYFALVGKDGPDSFQKRSIHAHSLYDPYSQFEFRPGNLPPGTRVETGIVYPWFDSPGGSRQVRLYTVHSVTKEHMYLSAQQLLEGPNPVLVRKTVK
ncbi:glycohydrolase toxin TNT-related protein, partial [Schaalia odontolytica]|uniref:TNT domain-containing protein n=1 Tax=Schaalia odontolytica TaxID=1660 RepID=UPI003CF5B0DD